MKHFVNETRGKTVVMGRKTFESIGKPLPNRINVVLTTKPLICDGIFVFNNIEDLFVEQQRGNTDFQELYIIGGKSIYEQFLPYANELIISKIKKSYECDTFMNIDTTNFKLANTIHHDLFDVEFYIKK
ncbi:hypothetical protein FACS189459_1090 [Bacilli bacterium]|nr:hypothetical protein FACS189459_1090 [Bacilli bacterium]